MFRMSSNHHSHFYEVGDVPTSVAGSICFVYGNWDCYLASLELVFIDKALINGAASATTIEQSFHG